MIIHQILVRLALLLDRENLHFKNLLVIYSLKRSLEAYKSRFLKAKGVIKAEPPMGRRCHLTYAAALLLLVRAKYLFLATLNEDQKGNAYACYLLTRGYFETSTVLGYLAIMLNKKIRSGDLESVDKISFQVLQGGKHFPTDEYLKEVGMERVPPINVYDSIDAVDSDFGKLARERSLSEPIRKMHREAYDVVLSEFGHPNHLGLQICSSFIDKEQIFKGKIIDLEGGTMEDHQKDYLGYLDWASVIFFHYWDKLSEMLQQFDLKLPTLK